MTLKSIRCPVLGAHVVQVTDFEGTITRLICSEYDATDGTCRLRKFTTCGGPLSRLLERAAEDTLDKPGAACVFHA